ncbi:LysM peptidoglycan-binding domain-containing protein [Promicromonospora iranensis]|uniref:Nucleoid-associated protein YgaU n=1 Tax=Promicromonospora iranensis TaxID=1105144 RepID=A0ABU2CIS6_9MICO|nr:LysM peptidoglycan-binding domain-containing protein [Promicromonospora iranensis]MDR7381234.1 nucleoid-associated protein YgaU [Promicromonospora iranensis]
MRTPPTAKRALQRARPGVRPTTGDRLRGLAATIGLLLLVVGVPVVLELARHRLLPAGFGWDDLGLVLTSAGSTTLVVIVLGCVTWAAWAYLTLTIGLELVALSGRIALPGPLGFPRGLARRLLSTASLLFVVSVPPALADVPADAATSHTESAAAHTTSASPGGPRTPAHTTAHTTSDGRGHSSGSGPVRPRTVPYTVVEDDSLWSIARDQLGDPMRFTELKDLNQAALADRPDFLVPGTVLRLPASPSNDTEDSTRPDMAAAETTANNEAPRDATYVVRGGDTLTQIALDKLGDADRYPDIARASRQTVQPDGDQLTDPDRIKPGWRLTIPAITPTPASPSTSTSARDTTQGRSAETETAAKDPRSVPDTREQDRVQEPAVSGDKTGVDTATGPDVTTPTPASPVHPGSLPGSTTSSPDGSAAHDGVRDNTRSPDATAPAPHTNPWAGPTDPPRSQSAPAPAGSEEQQRTGAQSAPEDRTEEDQSEIVGPGWLLPGLAGAGGMLAAGLLVALRRRRATQWRYRYPGHRITPAPSTTVPVERTIATTGQAWVGDIDALDRLLRGLAEPLRDGSTGDVPALVAVELTGSEAVVHLAEPADLPLPWVGSGTRWTAALTEAPPEAQTNDLLAPYRLLVTVGMDDAGHVWLLDLEQAGTVTVTGDSESVEAFGRYVTAELLLHPWAENTTLHTLATGWDVTGLSDFRHHHDHTDDHDTLACVNEVDQAVNATRRTAERERDESHALIAAPRIGTTTRYALHTLTANLHANQDRAGGRPGAAVVLLGAATGPSPALTGDAAQGLVLDVREGRLRVPYLGWDLTAVGLAEHELAASVAIVEVTRTAEKPPPDESTTQDAVDVATAQPAPVEPVHAGHVPAEMGAEPPVAQQRPVDPQAPAGPWSLLPAPTAHYVEAAATTAQDVEVLAPVMSQSTTSEKALDADPTLGQDVAAWFDPDRYRRPRLMLLGPVTATAYGRITEHTARLKALHVETLAYLALHPRGATPAELAEDFAIAEGRGRSLVTGVRAWLGTDPATGRPYVPGANKTAAFATSGTPAYQVEGLLVDIDLFQRLQARARARGADGIDDLVTALKIVRGRPFDKTRTKGWTWLFEGDRIDHTMTAAIGDVAHLVYTRAMAEDDIELARWAAQVGKQANPDDETARLDDITIQYVTGHAELARKRLAEEIYDRTDDEWPPPDPPERTREITARRGMTPGPSGKKHRGA